MEFEFATVQHRHNDMTTFASDAAASCGYQGTGATVRVGGVRLSDGVHVVNHNEGVVLGRREGGPIKNGVEMRSAGLDGV